MEKQYVVRFMGEGSSMQEWKKKEKKLR